MLVLSSASLVFWISGLQFLKNPGCQTLIYQIVCVACNDARPVDRHSFPFPPSQPEYLLVELVWEAFGPGRKFFHQEAIKNRLQGESISKVLVSGRLINQGSYSYDRETTAQDFALLSDVYLIGLESVLLFRVLKHVTYLG